ncbi:hypothetical protein H696_04883 [Fonticula alba]|uniref:Uncharacterized protein n=1 Tax=Fonticula alba TaxID=691883 RepID=A0A058Z394_FONAL|nr:hypothetical protein H696_04883 [Fonticula alba]KCV68591.1 hypothetical protein H696_04883 [Fonticula alba]|eukprot:XP_009497023.1 hypothetical protein H696_04883 [Fonticula alba]
MIAGDTGASASCVTNIAGKKHPMLGVSAAGTTGTAGPLAPDQEGVFGTGTGLATVHSTDSSILFGGSELGLGSDHLAASSKSRDTFVATPSDSCADIFPLL